MPPTPKPRDLEAELKALWERYVKMGTARNALLPRVWGALEGEALLERVWSDYDRPKLTLETVVDILAENIAFCENTHRNN